MTFLCISASAAEIKGVQETFHVMEMEPNQWIYRAPFVKSLGFYSDKNLDLGGGGGRRDMFTMSFKKYHQE